MSALVAAPVTARLIEAARRSVAAREALDAVDWAGLPLTLRALGHEQTPEVAALLSTAPTDSDSIVVTRRLLATIGDRAYRNRHPCQRAVVELCRELVGLTGEAHMLLDRAQMVVREAE